MAPPVEICIPSTTQVAGTDGDKAHTLYNITLRLPLRSFVVQKRYSDFDALHTALTNLVGEAPPSPLPSKTWFRSTLRSPDLTESRREGFESYLREIAESPDRRWRDTTAWRAFLNLPSTSASSAASGRSQGGISAVARPGGAKDGSMESRIPAIGLATANAAAASDPGTWIDLHKEMKRSLHDARLHLARRDAAFTAANGGSGSGVGPSTAAEAGVAAKTELVKVGNLLSALTTGLKALQDSKRLGDGELRRRRDLLAAARVERDGLETLSTSIARVASTAQNNAAAVSGDKAALFGNAASSSRAFGGRVLGAPLPETERTRELENADVLQLQKQMQNEQDQEVEALAKIVQRQRQLGLALKHEVDMQSGMLEQMHEDVDRVQGKVKVARERTKRLNQ